MQVVHDSFLISKVNDMAKYTNKQYEFLFSLLLVHPIIQGKTISAQSTITPIISEKLKVTDDVTREGSMFKLFSSDDDVQSFFFEVVLWK